MQYFPDPTALLAIVRRPTPPVAQKAAFAPSPGIQQAVMAQAQGGGMPPGGPMPGGDPAQQAGAPAGGPPPGMSPDPAAGQAGPPPDASTPSPADAKIDQLTQMMQQLVQAQAQGGAGPGGKPNTASLKFEPQHFHQVVHDISNIKSVLTQMADQLGLQVPASELLSQPAPGQTPPPGTGQDPAQAAAGGPPAAPGGAQPPGGAVAQQLPALPPVAAKAAGAGREDVARTPLDVAALGRLGTGWAVGGAESPKGGTKTAKLAAFVGRKIGGLTVPLIVESFGEGGRDAATTAATRVVVRDEHGNPLVIAVEHGEGKIHVSHFLDPEFEPLARAFGLVPPRVIQTIPLPGG